MTRTAFAEAPARLLDLIFQRGDFALPNAKANSPGGSRPAPVFLSQDAGDQAVRKYAEGALGRKKNDLASCPPGSRNDTINAVG